jgi:ArsR family transcriptional regulator
MEIPDPIKDQIEESGGLERIFSRLPDELKIERRSQVFKALSDPQRLKILYLLLEQDLCVCCIKEVFDMPDSKLSYHLMKLKDAGLIEGDQNKNWIIYRPTELAKEMIG